MTTHRRRRTILGLAGALPFAAAAPAARSRAARSRIAAAYGWPGEVILTSGASESLAIALTRAAVARRLVSAVEHDAVFRACPGAEVLGVEPDGRVRSPFGRSRVERPCESSPRDTGGENERILVAIQWANSETGVRQPIAAADSQRRRPPPPTSLRRRRRPPHRAPVCTG